jgi:hypothetical protein
VLFLLFGSSGAGKSAALDALRRGDPGLAVHDFDEIGVPAGADTAWRQEANEEWLRRALAYQEEGIDLLLAGQTPLGELLAGRSAPRLDAVSACLLDCDDETRAARLQSRGAEWLDGSDGTLQDVLNWGAWLRGHAADPEHRPEVIRGAPTDADMRWSRWAGWKRGDPRWRVRVVDTSALAIDDLAAELRAWIESERTLYRSGGHPLTGAALAD